MHKLLRKGRNRVSKDHNKFTSNLAFIYVSTVKHSYKNKFVKYIFHEFPWRGKG